MPSRCRVVFACTLGLVIGVGCAGQSDEGTGVDADAATPAADSAADVERLQGEWDVVSSASGGVEFDAAMIEQFTMTVTDDVMVFDYSNGNTVDMRFTLDETTSPKTIVLTTDGDFTDLTGIYRLEGDRLTLCVRTDGVRPTEFSSEGDGPPALTVYQRGE